MQQYCGCNSANQLLASVKRVFHSYKRIDESVGYAIQIINMIFCLWYCDGMALLCCFEIILSGVRSYGLMQKAVESIRGHYDTTLRDFRTTRTPCLPA
jgi:hypothetical protein